MHQDSKSGLDHRSQLSIAWVTSINYTSDGAMKQVIEISRVPISCH